METTRNVVVENGVGRVMRKSGGGGGMKKSGGGGARNMTDAGGVMEKRFAGCGLEPRISEGGGLGLGSGSGVRPYHPPTRSMASRGRRPGVCGYWASAAIAPDS
jgi:hypothetical protein